MDGYDIVHFHSFNPLMAFGAILTGAKIVYTEHGNFGLGRKRRLSDRINSALLSRFLAGFVHMVSFNSLYTKATAEQRYDLASVRREVVYNGINLKSRFGEPQGTDERLRTRLKDKFVVGTSSRFVGFKRIDRLVRAFALFKEGHDVALLLVGDGPLRTELEALVKELGIDSSTIFTGYQKQVRSLQELMDVCVFPSESEPFGLVSVETLALGKPTIVFSDSGGLREVVKGLDPEDIVESTMQLVDRLRYYYIKGCLSQAEKRRRIDRAHKFGIGTMAERFEELYIELSRS